MNSAVNNEERAAQSPRRSNGSQCLNQHSMPISKVACCNTNVSLGDASHTFYTTLYKSIDTQAEDKY